ARFAREWSSDVCSSDLPGGGRDDWAATAEGAAYVAVAAATAGVRLVHVSSDAVLAESPLPQDESALPNPLTRYGAAKAAAETVRSEERRVGQDEASVSQ